jgi:hypothetical protein
LGRSCRHQAALLSLIDPSASRRRGSGRAVTASNTARLSFEIGEQAPSVLNYLNA